MAAEKNFENRVKGFLSVQGAYFIKYWGGGDFTKAGVPDIIACVDGHFLGIEVKAPNGRASPLQIHNLRQIEAAGGYAILLYPNQYELFQNFIKCLKENWQEGIRANYWLLKQRWCPDG